MTEVPCKKCGHALPLDGGLPPVWKVVKCPSCNHANIIQRSQLSGGLGPGKMATPSIPVTLGPPGGKSTQAPPQQEQSETGGGVDLGAPGNETVQEEAGDNLQELAAEGVALGESGDETLATPPLFPSAGDVDLGESGNESFQEGPEEAQQPAAGDAGSIDLGAPGNEAAQQHQLARDTAATVDIGPPGAVSHDLLSLDAADDDLPGLREEGAEGLEIVDLPGVAGVAGVSDTRGPGSARRARGTAGEPLPEPDSPLAGSGESARGARDDAELPAPVLLEEPEILDLPPPHEAGARPPGATPGPGAGVDLPVPSRAAGAGDDVDLPVPAAPEAPRGRAGSAVDLPMPMATSKDASHGDFDDLPQPVEPARASGDLPAPKGFFDDLPQPANSARAPGDLPAPKGFFDDLPQPAEPARASGDLPAPRQADAESPLDGLGFGGDPGALGDIGLGQGSDAGGFDPLGGQAGGFDPLGGQAGGFDPLGGQAGGFDPLGGQADGFDPLGGQAGGSAADASPSAPAAGTMGDDPFGLGGPSGGANALSLADPDEDVSPSTDQSYDMNSIDLEAPRKDDEVSMAAIPLDRTGPAGQPGPSGPAGADKPGEGDALGLDTSGEDSTLGLDLGLPDPSVPGMPAPPLPSPSPAAAKPAAGGAGDELGLGGGDGDDFGGLELPSIAAAAAEPSAKAKPKPKKPARQPPKPARKRGRDKDEEDVAIGIEETAVPRVVQGHMAASALTERHLARQRQRRKRILIASAALVFLVVGAGGFFMYQRWNAERTREAAIQDNLRVALEHLRQGESGHWEQAMKAAGNVLELDPKHPDALGLAAEAAYAALLDEGLDVERWRGLGGDFTLRIDEALLQGPHVEKAQALKSIDQGRPRRAIERLQAVLQKAPDDPDALLYLGWAHAAAHEYKDAAGAFQRSLEHAPGRKVPALYGLAQVQLAQGEPAGAHETFEQVLAIRDGHYGALVGRVEAARVDDPDQHAAMYMEIIGRPDVDRADPRAVSRAWMLAGRLSLNAGRVEEARDRFANALKVSPANSSALVGRAKVALLQERYQDAREALTAVLGTDPERVDAIYHADAVLVFADLSMRTEQIDLARSFVDKVLASEESIENQNILTQAYLMRGRLLGTDESKREDAIAAYERALELAGDETLEPALALADLYTTLGRIEKARAVLAPIEQRAGNDAVTAVALGIRYKRASAWGDAETWLRRALEMRPSDIDAQFQLGQVLAELQRHDEAIEAVQQAFTAAPERTEIGLYLAQIFDTLGRVDDAKATYERMLASPEPNVDLMAQAGRFHARHGQPDKAGELGARILAVKENDPAGLFLRGEGQYARGEYAEARNSFQLAVDASPEPQYLEASGRASEKLDLNDEAFEAYSEAARRAPEYLDPRLGRARLLIVRRDFQRAVEELGELRKMAPQDPRIFHLLGRGYQEQGQQKEAISLFRTALGYDDGRAETHYRLGKAYLETSKERDAADALGRATRLASRAGEPVPAWLEDAYYELGYVLRSLSKRRQAVTAWRSYLERVPPERERERKVVEVKRLLMSLEAQIR